MKLITLILLPYLMTLFLVPCSDALALPSHADNSVELSHNHDNNLADTCSPFCVCTCCGIALQYAQDYTLEISTPFFTYHPVKQASKDFDMVDNFLSTIWQPPKY